MAATCLLGTHHELEGARDGACERLPTVVVNHVHELAKALKVNTSLQVLRDILSELRRPAPERAEGEVHDWMVQDESRAANWRCAVSVVRRVWV